MRYQHLFFALLPAVLGAAIEERSDPRGLPTTTSTETTSLALPHALAEESTQSDPSFTWKGYTWYIKSGTGMGPGPNTWSSDNVFVDSNGYLHFKITNNGGVWNCAEVYTDPVKLGFGTFQWQVDGRVDAFDPSVVLGFFNYGPTVGIGSDGTNEIDIEFSKWNNPGGANGWWTVYPYTGSGTGQKTFTFSLSDTLTTNRYTWTSSGVQYWMMTGLQPVSSTANLINSWTYAPAGSSTKVPQEPIPIRMNLWLYKGTAPASGSGVEIIVRDFQFVPEGGASTTYNIAASAGSGGAISPSGTVAVAQGSSQTFTITPDSSHIIASVVVDGASAGSVSSYTFSNVQAAHTITASFTATGTGTGGNLLTNPGFENGVTGWTDWGGMTLIASGTHSGSGAVSITQGDGGGCQDVAAQSRTSITVSGWARAGVAGEKAYWGIDWLNASGTVISHKEVGVVTSTAWTANSASLSVPSGTATIRLWVYHNPGSGTVYFDDFVMQ